MGAGSVTSARSARAVGALHAIQLFFRPPGRAHVNPGLERLVAQNIQDRSHGRIASRGLGTRQELGKCQPAGLDLAAIQIAQRRPQIGPRRSQGQGSLIDHRGGHASSGNRPAIAVADLDLELGALARTVLELASYLEIEARGPNKHRRVLGLGRDLTGPLIPARGRSPAPWPGQTPPEVAEYGPITGHCHQPWRCPGRPAMRRATR